MFSKIEVRIRSNCTAFLAVSLLVTAPAAGEPMALAAPDDGSSFKQVTEGSATTYPSYDYGCGSGSGKPCIGRQAMRELQLGLNALGFNAGPADGIFGLWTLTALNEYRAAKGIDAAGYPLATEAQAIMRAASGADRGIERHADAAGTALTAFSPNNAPVPTRVFAGPGQFPPSRFRGYGFLAFPALASEYDYDRHMKICQAYVNSLPATSSVKQPRGDQFVTVWPIKEKRLATALNGLFHRHEAAAYCSQAIDHYDDSQSREVMANVRAAQDVTLDGRGPYLFGWIPADEYGRTAKFIINLDLSRVTTYEQALVQLQSWQQKIATNPELLREGLSVENMRRTIRDWSDQHGQAFLMLIGAG